MPTAVERIDPLGWSLAGSAMIGQFEQSLSWLTFRMNLRRTGGSLKFIRRFGPLSSSIRSAMLKKTNLPKVEINTANGTVTLENAQIVSIAPHSKGGHPEGRDTYEQEEVSFSFQKITWTDSGKTAQDDWTRT